MNEILDQNQIGDVVQPPKLHWLLLTLLLSTYVALSGGGFIGVSRHYFIGMSNTYALYLTVGLLTNFLFALVVYAILLRKHYPKWKRIVLSALALPGFFVGFMGIFIVAELLEENHTWRVFNPFSNISWVDFAQISFLCAFAFWVVLMTISIKDKRVAAIAIALLGGGAHFAGLVYMFMYLT